MRAPEFWSGEAEGRDVAPFVQAAMQPLSWIWIAVTAARIASAKPERVDAPVICVGNLTVGGVGKTPIVRALRARLGERGVKTAVLLRGHGGRLSGPVRVDISHLAADVGDEALLHANDGLTVIARDRVAGARLAVEAGAELILMDDGFQNPALAKDASLIVVDARVGFGNGRVVPAGPLREPIKAGLARADAIVRVVNAGEEARSIATGGLPVIDATIQPTGAAPTGPVVAFAGIGRPEKFFATLRASGAEIVDAIPFADHHPYTDDDVAFLTRLAAERGARLVTTEKDHVRLPIAAQSGILHLPVSARFADAAALDAILDRVLSASSRS